MLTIASGIDINGIKKNKHDSIPKTIDMVVSLVLVLVV